MHTRASAELLTQLRTSRSFNFTSSSHALVTTYVTNTAIRRIADLYRTPIFLTAIRDSRLCLLLALLFCLLLAMLLTHGFLGPFPGCFFTDSWVPTLAVVFFLRSSLKLSPLTASRNLCRPRFVTTLDMMHCLFLIFYNS